jgi:hypothetical protein
MVPPCAATVPRCRTGTCGRRYQCLVIIEPKIVVTCWLKFQAQRARVPSPLRIRDSRYASCRQRHQCATNELRRPKSPVSGCFGLPRTDRGQQALRCGAIRADAFLELPDRPHSPCGPRVSEHLAQLPLSAPLCNHVPGHAFLPVIYQGIMPDLTAPCTRRCVATSLKICNVGSHSAAGSSRVPSPPGASTPKRRECARQGDHSALMPASLRIGHHFTISAFW